jgi:hypothetical protein
MGLHFSDVAVHSFAASGMDSMEMSFRLTDLLKSENIKLSSKDVILLDHSVNDAESNIHHYTHVRTGFERLIRTFLDLSQGNRPTIIALAMAPQENVYTQIYDEMARYYGVYLWSYSKLVNSEYMEQHNAEYLEYLKFQKNRINPKNMIDIHPPWYCNYILYMPTFYSYEVTIFLGISICTMLTC